RPWRGAPWVLSLVSPRRVPWARPPASTLPPGNSHKPAIGLPAGRCAISTRPSVSTRAQAATRTSLTLTSLRTDGEPGLKTARRDQGRRVHALVDGGLRLPHRAPNTSGTIVAVDGHIFLGEVTGQ